MATKTASSNGSIDSMPGAQIEVDVADGLSVLGTREGLDHIVQNLIDNAIK